MNTQNTINCEGKYFFLTFQPKEHIEWTMINNAIKDEHPFEFMQKEENNVKFLVSFNEISKEEYDTFHILNPNNDEYFKGK